MSDSQIRVVFEPSGRSLSASAGTKVMEAAGRAGLAVAQPCGGAGVCGKCRVRVVAGAAEPTQAEAEKFSASELADGWRLACFSRLTRDAVIHVPDGSLLACHQQILAQRQHGAASDVQPAVRKRYVELPEPTLADDGADLLRLEQAVGESFTLGLDLLRRLPGLLRQAGFKGTAVLADGELLDFEPGDTRGRCFGMAFDIGTTTIVGSLLDLTTGREVALASGINPQVSFGDDVLSRIRHSGSPAGLDDLRGSVLATLATMIESCCRDGAVRREEIYEAAFAGNTTMQHLLCGIEATQLGAVPFPPVFGRGLLLRAADLGLPIHPAARAYVFPVIGGFVGGDTVAGILASRMADLAGPVLLVDIGTNGEIVLAHEGKLLSSSTAAGPAFEGARISCGMRATRGAIEKVNLDGDIELATIAGAPPVGLCGSGLIDLAAGLLRCGIVSPEGRMLPPDELPTTLNDPLRRRVMEADGSVLFAMHEGLNGDGPLAITQRDIRELQLATGAIKAGIRILCKQAGLQTSDLQRVLIAGGFGNFIRRDNAQRIGLLPTDVHHEKIAYVGNTALEGAKWALLSTTLRAEAEDLARRTRHVELSQDMDFQMEFAEAMIFPET
ncbi:MAG: ASKHA domain-containing protein [Phycisphaerae bacterium]|nr:ASKHA domain-containing protein [Phycisphaerae bacterium]